MSQYPTPQRISTRLANIGINLIPDFDISSVYYLEPDVYFRIAPFYLFHRKYAMLSIYWYDKTEKNTKVEYQYTTKKTINELVAGKDEQQLLTAILAKIAIHKALEEEDAVAH